MNNSVLISIKPKWCELIASGKKTIEVRKTKPKIATPFKCYIYCTLSGSNDFFRETLRGDFARWNRESWGLRKGKVIGEFVCDSIDTYTAEFVDDDCYEDIRYHYTDCEMDEHELIVTSNRQYDPSNCVLCKRSCLSFYELKQYIGVNFHDTPFYGWHISDLVIYDKPKELSEFRVKDKMAIKRCNYRIRFGQPESVTRHGGWINGTFGCMKSAESEWCENCLTKPLTCSPQSWCYVEELK